MDILRNDMIIRLKNNQGKYLIALQDEESVSKSRDGTTKNVQWKIEMNDQESIYLKSCYGKYLTASNQPSIPGVIGRNLKVTQTQPEKRNTSHLWLPVSRSDPQEPHWVWLTTLHDTYLRAHSGPAPLGGMITHDVLRKDGPDPRNKKILWHIEIVDSPSNTLKHSESVIFKMLSGFRSFFLERIKVDKETIKGRLSHRFGCKTI